MKKYFTILFISVLLLLSTDGGGKVHAATQSGAVISIENKSSTPGELADISVTGNGFQNILIFEFWIAFNGQMLTGDAELKNYIVNLHPKLGNAQFNLVNDSVIGINWFRLSPIDIDDGARLFDLRLTFCDDADACAANNGVAEISFLEEHSFLGADDLVAIPLTYNNGSVYTAQPRQQLSLTFQGSGGATVNGQTYNSIIEAEAGSDLQLQALPATGSRFLKWVNDNGQTITNQPAFSYTMPASDASLTAHFEQIDYTVSLSVNPSGTANLSGAGTYHMGDVVSAEALAAEGYEFVNWTNGSGEAVSSSTAYGFTMPAADVSLQANFSEIVPDTYQLMVAASPVAGGTVSGSGQFEEGGTITLSASAKTGYRFRNWINASGQIVSDQAQFSYTMPASDVSLTARFELINYTVSLTVNPTGAATLTGAGNYKMGNNVSIVAAPAEGYQFVNWTNGSGSAVSTNATYNFSMPAANVSLKANFSEIIPDTYQLTLQASPLPGGTLSGSGQFEEGDATTLSASAKTGYSFKNWTNSSGQIVSGQSTFAYTMPAADVSLSANFEQISYTLSLSVEPTGAATLSGAGSYTMGEAVSLTAVPAEGYQFVNWTNSSGSAVSTNSTYNFSMPAANVSLKANFSEIIPDTYQLTLQASPVSAGNVSGSDQYEEGEAITLSAIAQTGYSFTNWTNSNGQTVSEQSTFSYTMPDSDVSLTARFELINYTVSLSVIPAGAATLSGAGSYTMGEAVSLTAVPAEGYEFVNWTNSIGSAVSTNTTYNFSMPTANVNLKANFAEIIPETYQLSLQASPVSAGNVSGSGQFEEGQVITLSAIAQTGYSFTNWTNSNGQTVSEQSTFAYTMPAADVSLTAHFEKISYTLSLSVEPAGAATLSGAGSYTMGEAVSLTAVPAEGYQFANWTNSIGSAVSTNATYNFSMPAANMTMVAHFELIEYNVSLTHLPEGAATLSGAGSYTMGEAVSLTAVPAEGYQFVNWTNSNDELVSSESTYNFSMPAANMTMVAHFELIEYNVSLTHLPEGAATLSGAGSYTMGEAVSLTAVPAEGYQFVNWTNSIGSAVSTNATYNFSMPAANMTMVAHFELIEYNVTLTQLPEGAAILTGAGTYQMGDEVSLEAVPAEGYQFVNWTNSNNELVSSESTYNFSMPAANMTMVAHFELIEYHVSLTQLPEGAATLTGAGTYQMGDEVSLEAVSAEGYRFVEWVCTSSDKVSEASAFSFIMPADDVCYSARFESIEYNVTLTQLPEGAATLTGAGAYHKGDEVSLEAVSAEGYRFVEWVCTSSDKVSEASAFSFIMPADDVCYSARFELNEYNVSLAQLPEGAAILTGAGNYHMGDQVSLEAVPAEGYRFVEWINANGNKVSNQASHSFSMPAEDVLLTASFRLIDYSVSLMLKQEHMARLSGEGIYNIGDEVILEAIPAQGYEFVNWTDADGRVISEESTYRFAMPAGHMTLIANMAYAGPAMVKAYPVPARDQLTIESNVNIRQIRLYNISGRLALSVPANQHTHTLYLPDLPNGVYILHVETEDGIQTERIQIFK